MYFWNLCNVFLLRINPVFNKDQSLFVHREYTFVFLAGVFVVDDAQWGFFFFNMKVTHTK